MARREESSVIVKVPDFTEILAEAYKKHIEFRPDQVGSLVFMFTHGYVETPVGIYLLDSEGCGVANPFIDYTEEFPYQAYLKDTDGFSMHPIVTIYISIKKIINFPVKEEVLLHDFVRSFGNRLEQNYQWCKKEFEFCM